MSEEQLKAAKAAEAEATAEQVEDSVEEISEEDLAGVAAGAYNHILVDPTKAYPTGVGSYQGRYGLS